MVSTLTVSAIPNPSAEYCEGLGYEFIIVDTPEGQIGVCRFSETENASAWEFMRGEEGLEHTYCRKRGYQQKIINDPLKCRDAYTTPCVICITENGTETEASKLLKQEKQAETTTTPATTIPQKPAATKQKNTILYAITTLVLLSIVYLLAKKKPSSA